MVIRFVSSGQSDQGHAGRPRIEAVRRFARSTQGISSVEFVIILPVLMLFLFGIITFASVLFIHVNMENAAREAVRRLAVADNVACTAAGGTETAPCAGATVTCGAPITVGTVEDYACTYLADWPVNFQVEAEPDATDCSELTVTVRLPNASTAALGDVFGFFNGRTLSAEVVMREEGACGGSRDAPRESHRSSSSSSCRC